MVFSLAKFVRVWEGSGDGTGFGVLVEFLGL